MTFTSSSKQPRKRPVLRILLSIAAILFVLAAGVVVLTVVFSDLLLNRYVKGTVESVFSEAYPGYELKIGKMHYNIMKDYTECLNVSLMASDSSLVCSAGSFSVDEIGWRRLVSQQGITSGVVKGSVLTASDVVIGVPGPGYEFTCGSVRVSVPDSEVTASAVVVKLSGWQYHVRCGTMRASAVDSELSAEAIEIRPLAGDVDFFSASPYRRTRVNMAIAQCYLRQVSVFDILRGRGSLAGTLDVFSPAIDLLVNREKKSDPRAPRPLMPGAALMGAGRAVRLDSLLVHDASLAYGERLHETGNAGTITFDNVQLSALGIGNARGDTIAIRASGRFMEEGVMTVAMTIPVTATGLSLSYSGSLTAMDLTRINRFLETAEHTRITSGKLRNASFDVRVARGRGVGRVKLVYDDLYITLLDKQTGSPIAFGKQIATLFANLLKIRGSNIPDDDGSMTIGRVNFNQDTTHTFMNALWFSLRSGVGDVVGF